MVATANGFINVDSARCVRFLEFRILRSIRRAVSIAFVKWNAVVVRRLY